MGGLNGTDTYVESPAVHNEPFMNGWFTLSVPSNGSKAVIKRIVRHSGSGNPVTVQSIFKKLLKEKVIYGIDKEKINQLVQSVDNYEIPLDEVVIAESDVVHGENGIIEWCIEGISEKNNEIVVLPGTKIAIRYPATRGKPGKNVFGKRVQPRPGFDQQLDAGNGISISRHKKGELVYLSDYVGILNYKSDTLSVDPQIIISEDRLAAHMHVRGLINNTNRKISIDDILNTIAAEGITEGLIRENIEEALEKSCKSGQIIENVLIAKGRPAVNGQDAIVDWQIDVKAEFSAHRAVYPGQLIAVRTPATIPHDGVDIFGKSLPATEGKEILVQIGEGVIETENDGKFEYRAKWIGTVEYGKNELRVSSKVDISDDKMNANLSLYVKAAGQTAHDISLEHVRETLAAYEVTYGIKDNEIETALTEAKKNNKSFITLSVAEGKPPKSGSPAELIIEKKLSIGKLLPNGDIDFHEKSYPWNMKINDVIGHVIPAVPAENGTTVTGETIPAPGIHDLDLHLEGAELGEDGKLRATTTGVLLVYNKDIKVADCLVINGNAGHITGNINADSHVLVEGYLEPGFKLKSNSGDVIIKNNVEDGIVYAQGNIVIKTGVRGIKSEIIASENISATFAENTKLISDGDMTILDTLINCKTHCKKKLSVGYSRSPKSTIIGGITQAMESIEAQNLGCDSYYKTVVLAGPGQDVILHLNKITDDLEKKISDFKDLWRIYKFYQKHPPPYKEVTLERIVNTRKKIKREYKMLRAQYDQLYERIQNAKTAKVTVRRKIYPGVKVCILDKIYNVEEILGPGTFEIKDNRIVYLPTFA